MAAEPDVFIDITTSAQWTGRATGIVRTERELAARAPALLGERLGYCVWSHSEGRYHALSRETAAAILAGELAIDLNPAPPRLAAPAPAPAGWRARLGLVRRSPPPPPTPVPQLHRLGEGPLKTPRGTTVLSAGLDWDYKDLRALRGAKQALGFRYVSVLYDLVAIACPHFVAPETRLRLIDYIGELFWTADLLLAISADTEKAGRAWCAKNRIEMAFARFEPGSDLSAAPGNLPRGLNGKRFALTVGTIEPRKNHRVLIDAWREALTRGSLEPSRDRLVFAGAIGWSTADLVAEIRTDPFIRDTVLIIEQASDGEIARLYTDAKVCCVPSHHEGYGLPLAEAQRFGTPCLASPAGALREIGGDAVTWLDPGDGPAWAKAISDALAAPRRTRTPVLRQSWDEAARSAYSAAGVLR